MCFLLKLTWVSCWSRATFQIKKLLCFQNKSALPSSQVRHSLRFTCKKKKTFSRFGLFGNVIRVNDWQTCVGNCQPSKHALHSQNGESKSTLLNLLKRFTIVQLWGTFQSSIANKDTKNKQKKMEDFADKLGLVQTFLFLHRFLFLISSSSVSHCSTWVPLH